MRKFLVGMVALLGLCSLQAQAQVTPKVRPSTQQSSAAIAFETLQDAVASVNGHSVPVPTGHREERLEVLWQGNVPTVFYNDEWVPSWDPVWSEDGSKVTIVTDMMSGGTYANGAMITFSLNEQHRFIAIASDYNETNAARGTIGGANSRGAISTDDESVCRCWGGDATVVRTACTTTACDDTATSCSTTTGVYCQWRATRNQ